MTNKALENACDHIADAFRPERQQQTSNLFAGHRVKVLVDEGRYGFPEACRLLEVDAEQITQALKWLIDDNARLNATYDWYVHQQTPGDYIMVGWFKEQADATRSDNVVALCA